MCFAKRIEKKWLWKIARGRLRFNPFLNSYVNDCFLSQGVVCKRPDNAHSISRGQTSCSSIRIE